MLAATRAGVIFAVLVTILAAIPSSAEATPVLSEPFEDANWHEIWVDWRSSDEANTSLTPDGYRSSGLAVKIPPGYRRGAGPLYHLPAGAEDVWFRYHLRLDAWRPEDSGKLPGFAGTPNHTARGCNPSTEADPGWSARMMFTPAGAGEAEPDEVQLGFYTYHLDQPKSCGEWMLWEPGIVEQHRWYCIEGHVTMNAPGANDGVLEGFVDGSRVFHRDDLAFRREAEASLAVRSFWLNVYFGGSTIRNDRNLGLRIDELVVGDSRVGCLTRFTDDDNNPHEPAIEFLFAEGLLAGCEQNLFCPGRLLSRAEAIALLARVISPPAATADTFTDDDGHWAEGAINQVAPLGIVAGCGNGNVCPDDAVSRGQFAAFLQRTFRFPAAKLDYFEDDDGSEFEDDINAIAAAGITKGCGGEFAFCVDEPLPRDQAATLLARAVQWELGARFTPPDPPPPPPTAPLALTADEAEHGSATPRHKL